MMNLAGYIFGKLVWYTSMYTGAGLAALYLCRMWPTLNWEELAFGDGNVRQTESLALFLCVVAVISFAFNVAVFNLGLWLVGTLGTARKAEVLAAIAERRPVTQRIVYVLCRICKHVKKHSRELYEEAAQSRALIAVGQFVLEAGLFINHLRIEDEAIGYDKFLCLIVFTVLRFSLLIFCILYIVRYHFDAISAAFHAPLSRPLRRSARATSHAATIAAPFVPPAVPAPKIVAPTDAVRAAPCFTSALPEREDLCCVCLTERKNMLFIPCMHLCACDNCVSSLAERGDKTCPICRAPSSVMKVFV